MEKKIPELTSMVRQENGAHIFYLSKEKESYIQNAIVFILDGIRNGDYVLMVENPRLSPLILQRLKQIMTEEELESVQFANNFEFYWREGNFLPVSIVEYFKNSLNIATLQGQLFRTWGHIEWGKQEELEEQILLYDQHAHQFISQHRMIAVCAYDTSRVSEQLQQELQVRHNFLMEDNQIHAVTGS